MYKNSTLQTIACSYLFQSSTTKPFRISKTFACISIVFSTMNKKGLKKGISFNAVTNCTADIENFFDDMPSALIMDGGELKSDKYRFAFNSNENDNEVKGVGNQQDYGKRIYDPRIGKLLSVDPITKKYPELTPYQFGSNRPIQYIDIDELEGGSPMADYWLNVQTNPTVPKESKEVYDKVNAVMGTYALASTAIVVTAYFTIPLIAEAAPSVPLKIFNVVAKSKNVAENAYNIYETTATIRMALGVAVVISKADPDLNLPDNTLSPGSFLADFTSHVTSLLFGYKYNNPVADSRQVTQNKTTTTTANTTSVSTKKISKSKTTNTNENSFNSSLKGPPSKTFEPNKNSDFDK